MAELMQASNQWATRPDDERYLDLPSMLGEMRRVRGASHGSSLPVEQLAAREHNGSLAIYNPKRETSNPYQPSNWAFQQLCARVKAPGEYLRTLPPALAAENLNHGLRNYGEQQERIGVYAYAAQEPGSETPTRLIRAVTGPNYGRIYNTDIVQSLIDRFGDGLTGDFRVPGKFGEALAENTKQDTTLYASDRDMFVFLADEEHRVELPNRRNGKTGSMARGFFISNSEVGSQTLWIAMFLFDYVCANRIVWGAEEFRELKIRHTANAPERLLAEAMPLIRNLASTSARPYEQKLRAAQQAKIGNGTQEDVSKFLGNMFGVRRAAQIAHAHILDENRPIETLWDASTGVTAFARKIPYQNERVEFEKKGGMILDLVAA